jgi:hypothetical protein
VSFFDSRKQEFKNLHEDEFKELQVEEFEDTLDIDTKDILAMFRMNDVLVIHEEPNTLKLVSLKDHEIAATFIEQTIVLNKQVNTAEGTTMPAKLLNSKQILVQKQVDSEWVTLTLGLHHFKD